MSFHQLSVSCGNQVSFHVINFGPAGATGANGGGTYTEIIHTMLTDGAITLPLVAALPGLQVYINGILQDDYTYTSTLLTLPATLNLITGDKLKITYFSNI